MPSIETKTRTNQEVGDRNALQRELLDLYFTEGSLVETDMKKIMKIFNQVGEILSNYEEYHSIIDAFKSGDYHGAAIMLKTVVILD